jgi:L-alanine-DL-glutamate epimerase-like enolase superfamily enzyme
VSAVREVAPEFSIVLDPNGRFDNPAGARSVSRALERFDRIILESPVPQQRLDWYVKIRQSVSQPVALHLTSAQELMAALQLDAADYYNLLGPLHEFCQWARMAQAAGCPTWRGTGMDLGVRDMSSIHAAAAAGCQLPSDIIGHVLREDDLVVEPIEFCDGCLIVPDRPGLGVTLDREALRKYQVA